MKSVAFRVAFSSFVFAATTVSPTRAVSAIPDAVERAAAFNAASAGGIMVEERHINLNVSAGPMHYTEQNDAVILLQDGAYKHGRYLRIVINGRTLSNDQVAERETQNNGDLDNGKGFFKQPYDARYLRDYTYTETDCTCAPHERQIAFHSEVRDDQHGDGTMILDPSTGRVASVTYSPNVMPQHASSGTAVETFGETSDGAWTIVSIDRTYGGRVAFLRGNGTMTERNDHFQRFGDPVAAMRYLQRATM